MTAMAQPLSGIDASHTDAMDLLSDTGFGGGEGYAVDDGDIEIDFGLEEGAEHVADDAISLRDATIEGDADHQAAPADADDDYMVDKDDLIEEDEIDYDDLELEDADRPTVDGQHEAAGQVNKGPSTNYDEQVVEEDLIDYSDEEDQQAEVVLDIGTDDADVQVVNTFAETVARVDHSAEAIVSGTEIFANGERDDAYEHPGGDDVQEIESPEHQWNEIEPAKWDEQSSSQHEQVSQTKPDASTGNRQSSPIFQAHEDADSIHQPEQEGEARQAREHSPELPARRDANFEANKEQPGHVQDARATRMHPVTLNYDGTELWLFKIDDSEYDEWLLEDESIATQPFVYLLQACRVQLGDDVNSETEIGIRFDNFHGLELYEDSTACACTSLKEFVDIYTTLHAQDDQTDPEPLYITLQFRPRVSALIGELKRAVQDQVGFTGLENAIATGQTSFSNTFYPASDVLEEQWKNEGEEGAEAGEENEESAGDDKTSHPDERNQGADAAPAQGHSAAASPAASAAGESANRTDEVELNAQDINAPGGDGEEHASTAGSHHGEPVQDDYIDYSDEEDEEEPGEAGKSSPREASSASSTVQGDEPPNDQSAVQGHTNDNTGHDFGSGNAEDEEAYRDTQDVIVEEEADYANYTQDGVSNNAGTIVDDSPAEIYEEGFESLDYSGQTVGPENYDNFYGNDGNTGFSQQNYLSLMNEAGDSNGQCTYEDTVVHTEEAYEGADDFVELVTEEMFNENPSGGPQNEIVDEIDYDDEEDAPEQDKTSAVSVAVPTSVGASNGLDDHGSPQGQKRPHDEIDGGLDDASDTTDSKRPKL